MLIHRFSTVPTIIQSTVVVDKDYRYLVMRCLLSALNIIRNNLKTLSKFGVIQVPLPYEIYADCPFLDIKKNV